MIIHVLSLLYLIGLHFIVVEFYLRHDKGFRQIDEVYISLAAPFRLYFLALKLLPSYVFRVDIDCVQFEGFIAQFDFIQLPADLLDFRALK